LPELPSEEELQERDDMIKVLSSMNSVYQNSHFYISKENEWNIDQIRMSLLEEIQVEGGYFPKELWQSGARRSKGPRARQDVASASCAHPTNIDLSLTRIEELARREGQSTAAIGSAGGTDSVLEDKDDGAEEERDDAYDDDDVFGNDDDPFQQYDDDEEYDEPDDDGGGDAYF